LVDTGQRCLEENTATRKEDGTAYKLNLSFPNFTCDTLLNYMLNDVDFRIGKYAIIINIIIISIVII